MLIYCTLLAEAKKHLRAGKGVIVDATFKHSKHRRWAMELRADLKERERPPEEVSDATWDIYLRQRDEFAPLSDVSDDCRVVSTEKPIDAE